MAATRMISARLILAPTRRVGRRVSLVLALGLFGLWTAHGPNTVAAADPIILDVVDYVSVADAPQVVPPLELALSDSIVVTDAPVVVPPLELALSDSIVVTDAPVVVPPLELALSDSIVVTDAPVVVPPLELALSDSIVVTDIPQVVPPLELALSDSVSVTDSTSFTPPGFAPAIKETPEQAVQYSDYLSFDLSATDEDDAEETLRFSASGLPQGLALYDNLAGRATISGTVQAPAGVYTASFIVADPGGLAGALQVPITVLREDGRLGYNGSTRVYAGTPGTLTATLAQAADGRPGDPARAAVVFGVTNQEGATTSHGPVQVSASGIATRTIPGGLLKGTYSVTVQIDAANGYFQAAPTTSTLAVSDPANPIWAVQYVSGPPSPGYSYSQGFFQFWQLVRFRNATASVVRNVMAYIDRVAPNTTIVDAQVAVGDIPAFGYKWSLDPFALRVDLRAPANRCDSFTWRIEYLDASNAPRTATDVSQFPPGPAPGGCR